jgi:uncharacterized protein (TIGR02246 family)
VSHVGRCSTLILVVFLLFPSAVGGQSGTQAGTKAIEAAVLAVHAEMTRAGEAGDADRLFSYMLETDKGSVVQNGVILATRREALEQVRANLGRISKIQYRWTRELVTVLSPESAVLVAEGESTATTASGDTFTAPFVQTVVFVLRDGAWKAIHAHQSSPRGQ